jgi:hypothetical protein
MINRPLSWAYCMPSESRDKCTTDEIQTCENDVSDCMACLSPEVTCFTICLCISPDFNCLFELTHECFHECFTICLFISPDLDGHRAPRMFHDQKCLFPEILKRRCCFIDST